MGCFANGVKSFMFKEKPHMHKLGNGTNFNLKDECINLSADQKRGNRKEFCSAQMIFQEQLPGGENQKRILSVFSL